GSALDYFSRSVIQRGTCHSRIRKSTGRVVGLKNRVRAEKRLRTCGADAGQRRALPDTCTAAKALHHSIISSARASTVGGKVSPMIFAAFRLITSSNLEGCSTGRSPGFAPLKIFSTRPAARRYKSG